VGALALVLLFGFERLAPRLPGGLVVLVVGIAVGAGLNLSDHGVATVGKIPTGLPSVVWPHLTLNELWVLIPSSLGMMLVIFSEALGAAETFADKYGYRLDANQEMIALGLANLGSGVVGGLACGGSLSQSAVNDGAGARSEASPLVAAALSLITVVALTPIFKDLPEAVLAALIIHAVSHPMKVAEMRRYYRLKRREFWLALATLLAVITLDVLPALIIGVVFSLILIIIRASRPAISRLGVDPANPAAFEDTERHPDAVPLPGVLIIRPDVPLFYANAQAVRDAVEAAVTTSDGRVHTVILDLDANDDLDITSAEQPDKLADTLAGDHIALALTHLHQPARRMAEATGLLDKIGSGHIFSTLAAATGWAGARRFGVTDPGRGPGPAKPSSTPTEELPGSDKPLARCFPPPQGRPEPIRSSPSGWRPTAQGPIQLPSDNHVSGKTVRQSCRMLATVQAWSLARWRASSAPAV
jgi:sulfate permease, SulP family